MILENKEYDINNKTTCDCGYEFNVHDIEQLKRINQAGFYGNAVRHYSHAKCKQCGKNVILLLKQVGQTYKIIDIATENVKEDTQSDSKNVNINENDLDNHVDETNNESKEFICPVCEKVCKSQIGLNSHVKTHQNN